MTFKLLQEMLLYKQVTTNDEDGYWEDGVYYEDSTPTVTYTEFEGDWEPVGSGEKTKVLPEGLMSSKAVWIYTSESLETATDLKGANFSEGDVVYLSDPTTDSTAKAFDIFEEEPWHADGGFQLLEGHNAYIAIRREKQ